MTGIRTMAAKIIVIQSTQRQLVDWALTTKDPGIGPTNGPVKTMMAKTGKA